jgi:hypothetical protein
MSDSPIKFPSSPLSNEDDLPAHQSFEEDVSADDWRPSNYSPPWSSEKEDPEEEDEEDKDEDDAEDENDNSDSNDVGVLEWGCLETGQVNEDACRSLRWCARRTQDVYWFGLNVPTSSARCCSCCFAPKCL